MLSRPLLMAAQMVMVALGSGLPVPASAQQVHCHVTYGGEERLLVAEPVVSPYRVPAQTIGSYFLFRIVFQTAPADLAAVRIYTYADREPAPTLVHQATHPYPPAPGGQHGFTGLQRVYEPVRDGELEYWCELIGEARP